ncbi:hypothetical protein MA16_Dca015872 [Dendrobium catenatum]|uniref:Uncharacterized protein n=1 Tax=Dendrobium catenatum TaxID=906689 RepID=A0A2I0VMH8_9ASPA|nr:hypothetical protein MA16_Dca015872 [Dendrobium catenatum]
MVRDPIDNKEVGYDEINHPSTFEGLEEKFLEYIMKLTKEQEEADFKENTQHRGWFFPLLKRSAKLMICSKKAGNGNYLYLDKDLENIIHAWSNQLPFPSSI